MLQRKKYLYFFLAAAVLALPTSPALATSVGNNVSVGGTLSADGATTLTTVTSTNATSSGYVDVGSISSSNANWAAGSLNVGNRLSVDGATYVSSTLDVTGLANFYSLSTFVSGFISNASSSIGSTLQVAGSTNVSSTLSVSGLSTLVGGFISNASSSVGGQFNVSGNVIPGSNNGSHLGAFGTAFGSIYSSTTIFATRILVPNPSGGPTTPSYSFESDPDTGFYKATQGTGFILSIDSANTLAFVNGSSTRPYGNGGHDLGQFYNQTTDQGPFKDIYSSGTLRTASSTVSQSDTSTIYLKSTDTTKGGRIVLKGSDGVTCYQLYFGRVDGATVGLTTSTVTCPD